MEKQNEKYEQAMSELDRLDDVQLVRRWKNCSDPIKKGVYFREIRDRGLTANDLK